MGYQPALLNYLEVAERKRNISCALPTSFGNTGLEYGECVQFNSSFVCIIRINV